MKIDEYVPHSTPIISGNANSLIDVTPRIYNAEIVNSVVIDVFNDLTIVSLIDLSTISLLDSDLFSFLLFSLIRSNTTMVSLIE